MVDDVKTAEQIAAEKAKIAAEEAKANKDALDAKHKDAMKAANAELAERNNTHDPVAEEKRNNERMFARDRLAASGLDPKVEAEVSAKLISDAEKDVAEAEAKLSAVKESAKKAKKDAEEATKKADEDKKALDLKLQKKLDEK